eukprot:TRINITY_DN14795_c0_g1_i1.p1 TRINITY_DN14795_c0_g1~~TRINITY_DN14795_c0_g1_i1.p1  ORF type:complete len:1551 (+),score=239.44 TRINITY_DN14795_c0_g1_i1:341-4654(+)
MAADSNVDFLFGPSFSLWWPDVAALVESYGKILVLWSFEPNNYVASYFTEMCPACGTRGDPDTLSFNVEKESIPSPKEVREFMKLLPEARAAQDSFLERGRPLLFDVNIRRGEWAQDAIRSVLKRKNPLQSRFSWAFMWLGDLGDVYQNEKDCLGYADYLTRNDIWPPGVTQVQTQAFYLFSNMDLVDQFMNMPTVNVVFFCGDAATTSFFLPTAERFWQSWLAFITSAPIAEAGAVTALTATYTNLIVEPLLIPPVSPNRTCGVFKNYSNLHGLYQEQFGAIPSIASLQVLSAGSLLVQALERQGSLQRPLSQEMVAGIADTIRTAGIETLLGRHLYDDRSQRLNQSIAAFRQLQPNLDFGRPKLSIAEYSVDANLLLVSPEVVAACQGVYDSAICNRRTGDEDDFRYEAFDLQVQTASVYPCPEGTILVNQACAPCEAGTFRRGVMLACAHCPMGRYINGEGGTTCRSCPERASCADPALPPRFSDGWYLLNGEWDSYRNVSKERPWELEVARCRPKELCVNNSQCVGDNTGLLCGSCKNTTGKQMTTYGITPMLRQCIECSDFATLVGYTVLEGLILAGVVALLSSQAFEAAHNPHNIGCAATKILLYHLQAMYLIMESSNALTVPFVSYLAVPLTLLMRPLHVMEADCLAPYILKDLPSRDGIIQLVADAVFEVIAFVPLLILCALWLRRAIRIFIRRFGHKTNPGLAEFYNEIAENSEAPEIEHFGDAVDSADKGRHRHATVHHWKILSGPGLQFCIIHEKFYMIRRLRSFLRHSLAMFMVISPAFLIVDLDLLRCTSVGSAKKEVLFANFEKPCHTASYSMQLTGTVGIMLAPSMLLLLFDFLFSRHGRSTTWREVIQLILAGYRPGYEWWAIVMMARFVAMALTSLEPLQERRLYSHCVIQVVWLALEVVIHPWERIHEDLLSSAQMHFGFALLMILGVSASGTEVGDVDLQIDPISQFVISAGAIVLNFYALGYFATRLFSVTLHRVDYFVAAGADMSWWTMQACTLHKWLHGDSPLFCRGSGAEWAIDHSKLRSSEKQDLLMKVKDLTSLCVAAGDGTLNTLHVQYLIEICFQRARQLRRGVLGNDFGLNGCQSMHSLSRLGFPSVATRDPDLLSKEELAGNITMNDLTLMCCWISGDVRKYGLAWVLGVRAIELVDKFDENDRASTKVTTVREWNEEGVDATLALYPVKETQDPVHHYRVDLDVLANDDERTNIPVSDGVKKSRAAHHIVEVCQDLHARFEVLALQHVANVEAECARQRYISHREMDAFEEHATRSAEDRRVTLSALDNHPANASSGGAPASSEESLAESDKEHLQSLALAHDKELQAALAVQEAIKEWRTSGTNAADQGVREAKEIHQQAIAEAKEASLKTADLLTKMAEESYAKAKSEETIATTAAEGAKMQATVASSMVKNIEESLASIQFSVT